MTISLSDKELIEQADSYYKEERLFEAARLLQQVKDQTQLTDLHQRLLKTASVCHTAVDELLSAPHEEWKQQSNSGHGKYPTSIYYKVESGARMTCRIETPVPSSMLVPLLSVLNESELYKTWIPSWTYPIKLGVQQSRQLLNDTRGHQIIQVQCNVPWPMSSREVLMDVIAIDDIDRDGFIIAKMQSITEDTHSNLLSINFAIPPVDSGMERIDFDGAVLFRSCPKDHPNLADAQAEFPEQNLLLLQFLIFFDAHMTAVPPSLIHFVTRTVIGRIWAMLLQVAEQVRDGTEKRSAHTAVIEEKAKFYEWIEERCQFMIQRMNQQQQEEEEEEEQTMTTTSE